VFGEGFGHGAEFVVSGDEIGFAIQFDEGACGAAWGECDFDATGFGGAVGAFFGVFEASLFGEGFGAGEIAFGFLEELFAIHEAEAG
jgi:hypothetical protein